MHPSLELINLSDLPETIGDAPDKAIREQVKAGDLYYPPYVAELNGKYVCVDGNRRIAAMRAAKFESWPMFVIRNRSAKELAAITVQLNANRRDNPATETQAIVTLASQGMSDKEISNLTGETTKTIQSRKMIASLNETLRAAYYEGHIIASTIDQVARMNPEQQEECALLYRTNKKITASEIKKIRAATTEQYAPEPENDSQALAILQHMQDNTPITGEELSRSLNALAQRAIKTGMTYESWLRITSAVDAYVA